MNLSTLELTGEEPNIDKIQGITYHDFDYKIGVVHVADE